MPPADFIWQDTFWLIWNISQKKFSLLDSNEVSKPLMRNLLLPICHYSTSFSQRFLKTYLPAATHRRPIFAKKFGNVSFDSLELNSDCLLGAKIFLFHWSISWAETNVFIFIQLCFIIQQLRFLYSSQLSYVLKTNNCTL